MHSLKLIKLLPWKALPSPLQLQPMQPCPSGPPAVSAAVWAPEWAMTWSLLLGCGSRWVWMAEVDGSKAAHRCSRRGLAVWVAEQVVPISSKATAKKCDGPDATKPWLGIRLWTTPACKAVPSRVEGGLMHISLSCWPDSKSDFSKKGNKKIFSFLIQKSLSCTSHSCAAGNYHHPGEPEKMPFFFLITTKLFNLSD